MFVSSYKWSLVNEYRTVIRSTHVSVLNVIFLLTKGGPCFGVDCLEFRLIVYILRLHTNPLNIYPTFR